ncbi:SIS domain-containing protein [Bifidobacterium sp. ESL0775]|uniref:D-sedoheptulose-7-phosphate isomerase n=1 Tax=Bifidobacterium sp. ESL0775 TaxID=2983230 RepID=UPI0023F7216C|nr:SIS domain-containing protein [Bifidobacterium sp. ESL0775]WEV69212.1 SIS domain-containing protein [Bifidobacterium sp. ESL0775]
MPTAENEAAADYLAIAQQLESLLPTIIKIGEMMRESLAKGGTIYTLGNGGSEADAQHFTGELIGHYKLNRRPVRAVTIGTDATTTSCISNDYSFEEIFSRQLEALALPGDVVVAFTTSGRSQNIVNALKASQQRGATTVLMSGANKGPADEYADYIFRSPTDKTPRIQEVHTFVLHVISNMIDQWATQTDEKGNTLN